jgi:hypothetical protein
MKKFLVIASLISVTAGAEEIGSAAKSVWLARLTSQQQCEKTQAPSLGQALSELERQGLVVEEGRISRLNDRAFCSSCDCPAGTFHVAKVQAGPAADQLVQDGEWEVVNEKSLPEGKYSVQPVVPQM